LISGVTGFVGRRLGAALSQAGWEVWGLGRDPAKARTGVPFLTGAIAWSSLGAEGKDRLREMDAVVHLAGESVAGLWTSAKRARIERSRIDSTRALVDALIAVEPRPRVLLSASAVGYYGTPKGDEPLAEDHAPGEGFLADVCRGWEREAERAEEADVRVVLLRIGLVLGPEGGTLGAMLPAFKAGLGGRIGSGKQLWPWIHIDDLVGMSQRALEDPRWSGPYNGVAPGVVTQGDFAKALAKQVHRPAFLPAPAFALKSVLGDFASEMLVSRRVVPQRAQEVGFRFRHPELQPALSDLLG
jgi:uncharacterized protein (TIGR01777 family)